MLGEETISISLGTLTKLFKLGIQGDEQRPGHLLFFFFLTCMSNNLVSYFDHIVSFWLWADKGSGRESA